MSRSRNPLLPFVFPAHQAYAQSRPGALAWLLHISLFSVVICGTAQQSAPLPVGRPHAVQLDDGTQLDTYAVNGVSHWQLFPYLWTDKTVNVTCPGDKDVTAYSASNPDQLKRNAQEHQSAWCGWHSLFASGDSCTIHISPFGTTYVAAVRSGAGTLYKGPFLSGEPCRLEVQEHFSPLLVGQAVAGALLFLYSDALSTSTPFRLSTGTLGFVALSSLIVLFILSRNLPSRKSIAVAFGVFGSTLTGAIRYLFGRWVPSLQQLIYNKVSLAYLVASGLVGLAVTYYYDDPANHKVNTILRRGLQLAGLALVALSTTQLPVSLALCAGLLAYHLALPLPSLSRRLLPTRGPARASLDKPADRVDIAQRADAFAAPVAPSALPQQPSAAASPQRHTPLGDSWTAEREPSQDALLQAAATALPSESGLHTPQMTRLRDGPAADQISPLVKMGKILNTSTGRTIDIGKATYNKLVLAGYVVDKAGGTLTPPPPGARPAISSGSTTPRA